MIILIIATTVMMMMIMMMTMVMIMMIIITMIMIITITIVMLHLYNAIIKSACMQKTHKNHKHYTQPVELVDGGTCHVKQILFGLLFKASREKERLTSVGSGIRQTASAKPFTNRHFWNSVEIFGLLSQGLFHTETTTGRYTYRFYHWEIYQPTVFFQHAASVGVPRTMTTPVGIVLTELQLRYVVAFWGIKAVAIIQARAYGTAEICPRQLWCQGIFYFSRWYTSYIWE